MSTEEEQAYAARWDDRWQKDVTPWDLGEPAPVLLSLFDKGELGDGTGKALVPGCGTGYEVTWIGSHKDWSATGLDLSPTANAVALKRRDALGVDPSRAQFLVGDFFLHEGTYDLVFDHTFLCALQPVSRPKWAAKMARLIRPGGILVGYIYPINTHTDGPPFALSADIYRTLLAPYFDEVFIRECDVTYEKRKTSPHKEMISKWIRKTDSI